MLNCEKYIPQIQIEYKNHIFYTLCAYVKLLNLYNQATLFITTSYKDTFNYKHKTINMKKPMLEKFAKMGPKKRKALAKRQQQAGIAKGIEKVSELSKVKNVKVQAKKAEVYKKK